MLLLSIVCKCRRILFQITFKSRVGCIKVFRFDLKGQSDGARIECKRGSETVFTTVTNVSKSKFIDERPNLIPNLPEKRQYRVWFLKGDKVVGIVSTIVTITVEG